MPFPLSLLANLIGLSCSHLNAMTMWNIVALSEGMMVHAGGDSLGNLLPDARPRKQDRKQPRQHKDRLLPAL